MRDLSPFRQVTLENRDKEEELFLDYLVHSTHEMKWAPSTLKLRIAAIRAKHVALGYDDPFRTLKRIYFALEGYKRLYGGKPRCQPITPAMLAWIRASLDPKRSRNDAAVWAAMTLGFVFLLRASEYVESGAGKE
eukprot:7471214-Heterocapsa_arctica.AAC.1